MEDFDEGGAGVAYFDTTSGNSFGQYRNTRVDIKAASDIPGYAVVAAQGEWLEYTVNVTVSGNYRIQAHVASDVGDGSFHVQVDGVNVTGSIGIPYTGEVDTNYDNVTSVTFPMTMGQHVIRVYMENDDFDLDFMTFSLRTR